MKQFFRARRIRNRRKARQLIDRMRKKISEEGNEGRIAEGLLIYCRRISRQGGWTCYADATMLDGFTCSASGLMMVEVFHELAEIILLRARRLCS